MLDRNRKMHTHLSRFRSGRPGCNSCVSLAHKPAPSAGRESSCIAPSDPESNIDFTIFITPAFYKYRAPSRAEATRFGQLDVDNLPINGKAINTELRSRDEINHSDRTPMLLVIDFVRQGLRETQCQQLWKSERLHTPPGKLWVMAVLYLARETEELQPAASKTT